MSLKIPTFWIFIGKKLLASPQNTANLRYNKVKVQQVWYKQLHITFVDRRFVSNSLNFQLIMF